MKLRTGQSRWRCVAGIWLALAPIPSEQTHAQWPGLASEQASSAARIRPIGQTPIRVSSADSGQSASNATESRTERLTETNGQVQQAAFLQDPSFALPGFGDNATPINPSTPPTAPSIQPRRVQPPPPMQSAPTTMSPPPPVRSLPSAPPVSDVSPIAPPQLSGGGFATVNNCALISPPSGYSASFGGACGPPVMPVAAGAVVPYQPPPATIAAPAIMPPPVAAVTPVPVTATPPGPLISLGQEIYPVQVGQGLWGQPVAYVPGQNIRNWVRYFFP